MTTYERLSWAIEYYKTHEWLTYYRIDSVDSQRCIGGALMGPTVVVRKILVGSLALFSLGIGWDIEALDLCAQAMGFKDSGAMVDWNNEVARDKAEIIARLEAGRDRLLHEEAAKAAVPTDELALALEQV